MACGPIGWRSRGDPMLGCTAAANGMHEWAQEAVLSWMLPVRSTTHMTGDLCPRRFEVDGKCGSARGILVEEGKEVDMKHLDRLLMGPRG